LAKKWLGVQGYASAKSLYEASGYKEFQIRGDGVRSTCKFRRYEQSAGERTDDHSDRPCTPHLLSGRGLLICHQKPTIPGAPWSRAFTGPGLGPDSRMPGRKHSEPSQRKLLLHVFVS
jgi:hypothetical protein